MSSEVLVQVESKGGQSKGTMYLIPETIVEEYSRDLETLYGFVKEIIGRNEYRTRSLYGTPSPSTSINSGPTSHWKMNFNTYQLKQREQC